jgi:hypothetical protein
VRIGVFGVDAIHLQSIAEVVGSGEAADDENVRVEVSGDLLADVVEE